MAVEWYRAESIYPHLGVWPGDVIRYDPESPFPMELYRGFPPNHGALLGAIESGALKPFDPSLPAARLRLESTQSPEAAPETSEPQTPATLRLA